MAAKKNSLVENINRRKRKGISRTKSRSTVKKSAYRDMQRGWPHSERSKTAKKKTGKKKTATKKKAKSARRSQRTGR
jgi:hypothetical protein